MPKVYIVNNNGHDYEAAKAFGELVICTQGHISKDKTDRMKALLLEALKDAEPDDYILVSSLTSLCMIAGAIMVEWFGKLNMLIYHDQRYVARTIQLEDM